MGVGLGRSRAATWHALGSSVAGSGHLARGSGCEDACAWHVEEDGTLLVAVADGAGSAPAAARGSAWAVAVAMSALGDGADVGDALLLARSGLEDLAMADERPLSHLATTLLVARATPGSTGSVDTARIGDGAIVLRRRGIYEVLAPDDKGEYINETCFLTSASWRSSMRWASSDADGVDGLAAMTDGLQLLAFDLATGAAHGPFFDPFLDFAQHDGGVEQLAAFLGSTRVAERTDDDVTLVVAALSSSV